MAAILRIAAILDFSSGIIYLVFLIEKGLLPKSHNSPQNIFTKLLDYAQTTSSACCNIRYEQRYLMEKDTQLRPLVEIGQFQVSRRHLAARRIESREGCTPGGSSARLLQGFGLQVGGASHLSPY